MSDNLTEAQLRAVERWCCSHPGVENWYDIRECDMPLFVAALLAASRTAPEATPESAEPVAWLLRAKNEMVRSVYTRPVTGQDYEFAAIDGDTITLLYAAPQPASEQRETKPAGNEDQAIYQAIADNYAKDLQAEQQAASGLSVRDVLRLLNQFKFVDYRRGDQRARGREFAKAILAAKGDGHA